MLKLNYYDFLLTLTLAQLAIQAYSYTGLLHLKIKKRWEKQEAPGKEGRLRVPVPFSLLLKYLNLAHLFPDKVTAKERDTE